MEEKKIIPDSDELFRDRGTGDTDKYLPVDPSKESEFGQNVEQGVVKRNEGISEQSAAWEDIQERGVPGDVGISDDAEKYIKDPSPEEVNKPQEDREAATPGDPSADSK